MPGKEHGDSAPRGNYTRQTSNTEVRMNVRTRRRIDWFNQDLRLLTQEVSSGQGKDEALLYEFRPGNLRTQHIPASRGSSNTFPVSAAVFNLYTEEYKRSIGYKQEATTREEESLPGARHAKQVTEVHACTRPRGVEIVERAKYDKDGKHVLTLVSLRRKTS